MKVFKDEETMNKYIIMVLKDIRTNMGLSQPELESKLGLGTEYISKIERGKSKISLELLRKFTTVFNISISDIISRAEAKYGIQKWI